MSEPERRHPRFKVHLSVRYGDARAFVEEYAENLSRGGLFIAGAHRNLKLRDEVTVEIALPGAGAVQVQAEVAHVLGPEEAARMSRRPGAGLAITRSPEGFEDVLASYLLRLGRRREATVLVDDRPARQAIEAGGYATLPLPPADELVAVLAHADPPIFAVVATRAQEPAYRAAAAPAGAEDLIVIAPIGVCDDLLTQLDGRL